MPPGTWSWMTSASCGRGEPGAPIGRVTTSRLSGSPPKRSRKPSLIAAMRLGREIVSAPVAIAGGSCNSTAWVVSVRPSAKLTVSSSRSVRRGHHARWSRGSLPPARESTCPHTRHTRNSGACGARPAIARSSPSPRPRLSHRSVARGRYVAPKPEDVNQPESRSSSSAASVVARWKLACERSSVWSPIAARVRSTEADTCRMGKTSTCCDWSAKASEPQRGHGPGSPGSVVSLRTYEQAGHTRHCSTSPPSWSISTASMVAATPST